jgi:hypothetical protein
MNFPARCAAQTLAVLAASGMTFGMAHASIIRVDDSTDTITVTVDNTAIAIERLPNTTEAIRFTFTSTVVSSVTGSFSTDLIETTPRDPDNGGLVSDRFFLQFTMGSPNIGVLFASDPDISSVPPAQAQFDGFFENGGFQDVIFYRRIGFEQPGIPTDERPAAGLLIDTFQVRSDVPEPATLALFGIGALALLGRRWRRRKQGYLREEAGISRKRAGGVPAACSVSR